MSAICGVLHANGQPVEHDAFQPVIDELAPYGQDGTRFWSSENVAFGQQMTWTTPESRHEVVPFCDNLSQLAITADARIDNRDELCSALGLKNTEQLGDSQIILYAYQKWGTDCAAKLLGDFAFAIRDARQQKLFCARDFVGVRPFYYAWKNNTLVFASDVAAVLKAQGVTRRLDLPYLSSHFQNGQNYPHDTHTAYDDIRKLAPSHWMIVDASGLRTQRYWDPESLPEVRCANNDEYGEALRNLFEQSVKDRIRCDFPVGAHLSGGLDSSGIGVIASRLLHSQGRQLTGFSWAPPPGHRRLSDERALVEELQQTEDIPVHYTQTTFADSAAVRLRNIGKRQDAEFPHERYVRRQASQAGVRTILSGWGGDELIAFNGRNSFAEMLITGQWPRLYREVQAKAALDDGVPWKCFVGRAILPLLPGWMLGRDHWRAGQRFRGRPPGLFVPEFQTQIDHALPLAPLPGHAIRTRANQLALWQRGHLTQRIEGWATGGGRCGITYAYPSLDRRVVEFALGLPPEMFFQNGWKRFLFRHAMQGILPDNCRWALTKREPSLNNDRERVNKETGDQLPPLVANLVLSCPKFEILDETDARAAAREILQRHRNLESSPVEVSGKDRPRQGNLQAALVLEQMVNPQLEQTVTDCLADEIEGHRQAA